MVRENITEVCTEKVQACELQVACALVRSTRVWCCRGWGLPWLGLGAAVAGLGAAGGWVPSETYRVSHTYGLGLNKALQKWGRMLSDGWEGCIELRHRPCTDAVRVGHGDLDAGNGSGCGGTRHL